MVSYRPLLRLLEQRDIDLHTLMENTGIAPNTMTKIRRNEEVSMTILSKICANLGVSYGDIVEYVSDDEYQLQELILSYIKANRDCPLVQQMRNLEPITESAIDSFFGGLFELVEKQGIAGKIVISSKQIISQKPQILSFIRTTVPMNPFAVQGFLSRLRAKGFDEEQCKYIMELFKVVQENGKLGMREYVRAGLKYDGSFTDEEINLIVRDLSDIFNLYM